LETRATYSEELPKSVSLSLQVGVKWSAVIPLNEYRHWPA